MFYAQLHSENGKSSRDVIVRFPAGYGCLPEPGGLLDQPNWTMSMFSIFMEAETAAAMKRLSK